MITKEVADFALDILDVDKFGLDNNDRAILITMIEKFSGGPVGLETLAASLGEDAGTLEDVYEPYLLMNEMCIRDRAYSTRIKRAVQNERDSELCQ